MANLTSYILIAIILAFSILVFISLFLANNSRNTVQIIGRKVFELFGAPLSLITDNGEVVNIEITSRSNGGQDYFSTAVLDRPRMLPTQLFKLVQSKIDPNVIALQSNYNKKYARVPNNRDLQRLGVFPAEYPVGILLFDMDNLEDLNQNPRLWFRLIKTTATTSDDQFYQFQWIADPELFFSIEQGFNIYANTLSKQPNLETNIYSFLVLRQTPVTFLLQQPQINSVQS